MTLSARIGGEDFVAEPGAEVRVFDGEDDFAAFEEVAGEPVGAAAVDLLLAAVLEVEDAAVFEKTADDGADADVFAEAFMPGAQGRHAADDEVDLHSGFGSGVEGFDDAGLEQGVHLGDDLRGLAGGGVFGLAMDEANEGLGEGERGDEQRLVVVGFGVRGEVAEDVVHRRVISGSEVSRLISV